jgi:hypothetical protein
MSGSFLPSRYGATARLSPAGRRADILPVIQQYTSHTSIIQRCYNALTPVHPTIVSYEALISENDRIIRL